ncbi:MAG TPA: class I SAM-dependent methyltransferase [Vicinamibacterales bacterium]|nr:class I SAM-dependent methyltransferase [Vicinamibacterales bacterium]
MANDSVAAPRIFTPEYYQRMRDLESGSWWNAGMRDVAAQLLKLASLAETGRVVDVGCGSGQSLRWFASLYPKWRTLGLDIAVPGLTAAKALGLADVMRGSALALPLKSSTADLVIMLDVLQHLPLGGGDHQALAEAARVLRPSGYLLVRTNAQSIPRTADDPLFDFHKYERPELRVKLEGAGFEVLRLGRLNAVLGLGEIPRELRALTQPHSYKGLLSKPRREPRWFSMAKRGWLRFEGRAICSGRSWPLGRTMLALCRLRFERRPVEVRR